MVRTCNFTRPDKESILTKRKTLVYNCKDFYLPNMALTSDFTMKKAFSCLVPMYESRNYATNTRYVHTTTGAVWNSVTLRFKVLRRKIILINYTIRFQQAGSTFYLNYWEAHYKTTSTKSSIAAEGSNKHRTWPGMRCYKIDYHLYLLSGTTVKKTKWNISDFIQTRHAASHTYSSIFASDKQHRMWIGEGGLV